MPRSFLPLAIIPAFLVLGSFSAAEEIPYRRAASQQQAVERIEQLGGSVRYLAAGQLMLEVDFQFAGDTLRDEHLKYLQRLENVVTLRLKQTDISDRGLSRLRKITTLRRLFLDQTAITDDGLKILAALPELEFLSLYGTAVTDEGLGRLTEAARLRYLFVAETGVSADGIMALQAALPGIMVVPDPVVEGKRSEEFLASARKLLADAEQKGVEAEKDFKELGPQKDELKKAADEAGKLAEEKKRQADELNKKGEEADKLVKEREAEAGQADKLAREKPDDPQLKLSAEEKQKVLAEARRQADEARVASDESRKEAEAAKSKSEAAKNLAARAVKVIEIHDQSKKVLEGARLRLKYAERDLPADQ